MLGWDQFGFNRKCTRSCCTELLFLHPVGSAGRAVHSGASRVQNIDALFLMLGLDRYGFNKKRVRTRYAELVFSHTVVSAFHVVRSGASGE
jgi:hypothetical protein